MHKNKFKMDHISKKQKTLPTDKERSSASAATEQMKHVAMN